MQKTQKELIENAAKNIAKMSPNSIKKLLNQLSISLNQPVADIIAQIDALQLEKLLKDFGYELCCPKCGSINFIKDGYNRKGISVYKCKDCNKKFSASTGTILEGSHYTIEMWISFIEYFILGLTGEQICDKMEEKYQSSNFKFDRKHVYVIRNKVFTVVKELLLKQFEKKKMSGTIKLDETYFRENQSGILEKAMFTPYNGEKPKRKARHGVKQMRYGTATDDFANVMIITDSFYRSYGTIVRMGATNEEFMENKLKPLLDMDNIDFFVSDSQAIFKSFCKKYQLKHVIINGENYSARRQIGGRNFDGSIITEELLYYDGLIGDFKLNDDNAEPYVVSYEAFKNIQNGYNLNLDSINNIHSDLKGEINMGYKSVITTHLEGYVAWDCYLRNIEIETGISIYTEDFAKSLFVKLVASHYKVTEKQLDSVKLASFDRISADEFVRNKKANEMMRKKYKAYNFQLHPEDNVLENPKDVIENMNGYQLRGFARFAKIKLKRYGKEKTKDELKSEIFSLKDYDKKLKMYSTSLSIGRKNEKQEEEYHKQIISSQVQDMIENLPPDEVVKKLLRPVDAILPSKLQFHPEKTYFFDVETTGIEDDDEVLSIGVVDGYGTTVLYSLCKPEHHTEWKEAEKINHITPKMVESAPTFKEMMQNNKHLWTKAQELISYNLDFDLPKLKGFIPHQTYNKFKKHSKCCMTVYAQAKNNNVPIKLKDALKASGISIPKSSKLHNALTDAQMCRKLWLDLNPNYFNAKMIKAAKKVS